MSLGISASPNGGRRNGVAMIEPVRQLGVRVQIKVDAVGPVHMENHGPLELLVAAPPDVNCDLVAIVGQTGCSVTSRLRLRQGWFDQHPPAAVEEPLHGPSARTRLMDDEAHTLGAGVVHDSERAGRVRELSRGHRLQRVHRQIQELFA